MYFREQLSISETQRRTSLSRNTIKTWLRKPEGSEPVYRRRAVPTKLTAFVDQLQQALATDAHRPKRERRTVLKLFAELQAAGFTGSYTRLSIFVRQLRTESGQVAKAAFVPLTFAL